MLKLQNLVRTVDPLRVSFEVIMDDASLAPGLAESADPPDEVGLFYRQFGKAFLTAPLSAQLAIASEVAKAAEDAATALATNPTLTLEAKGTPA